MLLVIFACTLIASSALAQEPEDSALAQKPEATELELRFDAFQMSEDKTRFDYGNGVVREEVDFNITSLAPAFRFGAYSGDFLLNLGFSATEEKSGSVGVGYRCPVASDLTHPVAAN